MLFYIFALLLSTVSCLTGTSSPDGHWPLQTFVSAPGLKPPVFDITKSGELLAPGYIFLAPISNEPGFQNAAIIITDAGELVWSATKAPDMNFEVQSLDNKPVLTYWTGAFVGILPYGYITISDQSYSEIYHVCPEVTIITPHNEVFPCYADIHELFITERGSMLITMYNITTADLSSVGGPKNGWVVDSLILDVDIKTNATLSRWSAIEAGIEFTESKAPFTPFYGDGKSQATAWDFFHINSVQPVGDGYVINGRHTWTVYKLNKSGAIEWRLQGETGGDFKLAPLGNFSWEHAVRLTIQSPTLQTLTLFNNASPEFFLSNTTTPPSSTGLILALNPLKRTAQLKQIYRDTTSRITSPTQGYFQSLPNGNVLLGYGQVGIAQEFGPKGDLRMTIQFGKRDNGDLSSSMNYRAHRTEWVGRPVTKPAVVVKGGAGWVSWNGDTEVKAWEVWCEKVNEKTDLKMVGKVKKGGFETKFQVPRECKVGGLLRVVGVDWGMRKVGESDGVVIS